MRLTLIAAQSIDGFITRHDAAGTAFTSPADKTHFAECLRGFDASVMGATTYSAARTFIRQTLTPTRRRIVLSRDPARFAADSVDGRLEFSADCPVALCQRLAGDGHDECALLGGGEIHRLFLKAGLVDRIWLTIEPRLFASGTPLVADDTLDIALTLDSVERLGSDSLLVKYTVNR